MFLYWVFAVVLIVKVATFFEKNSIKVERKEKPIIIRGNKNVLPSLKYVENTPIKVYN